MEQAVVFSLVGYLCADRCLCVQLCANLPRPCFVLSSSTRMWKTGGSLPSISVYPWPAPHSSTRSCPVRCSAAKKACESPSTTTWNRYERTVLRPFSATSSAPLWFCVCAAEGSSQNGLLPGADFCSLLAATSPQPYSEENNLWRKWPPPLWTTQVGVGTPVCDVDRLFSAVSIVLCSLPASC